MRPIFMQNIGAFWGMSKTPADRIAVFVAFGSRLGNKWIDETSIKTSAENIRCALKMYRMLHKIAAFEHIQPPFGGLDDTVKLYKRLKGLIDPQDRIGFGERRWNGKKAQYYA